MQAFAHTLIASNTIDTDDFLLTIAIPTFKREHLLSETISSIAKISFQLPVEVIVVDNDPNGDNSTAKTQIEPLKSVNYKYYRNQENVGMFGNWNQCLILAKGRYITILHDDDTLNETFAKHINHELKSKKLKDEIIGFQVSTLEQRIDRIHNTVSTLSSELKKTASRIKNTLKTRSKKNTLDFFYSNQFCGTLAVTFNRKMAIEIGGFEPEWSPISDYEFWCRWTSRYGPIPIVKKSAGQYRISENESMKVETRNAFTQKSKELRKRLINEKHVPQYLKHTISPLEFIQKIQIYCDWKSEKEPKVSAQSKILKLMLTKTLKVTLLIAKLSTALKQSPKGPNP